MPADMVARRWTPVAGKVEIVGAGVAQGNFGWREGVRRRPSPLRRDGPSEQRQDSGFFAGRSAAAMARRPPAWPVWRAATACPARALWALWAVWAAGAARS